MTNCFLFGISIAPLNQKAVRKTAFECFTDGIAKVYAVTNIAEQGDRPIDGLKLKYRLCYQYKTVGVKRFVEAQQVFMQVDEMISVPQRRSISTADIVILGNVQYRIVQVQHIDDTKPKTTKISLWKLEECYASERISG